MPNTVHCVRLAPSHTHRHLDGHCVRMGRVVEELTQLSQCSSIQSQNEDTFLTDLTFSYIICFFVCFFNFSELYQTGQLSFMTQADSF